MTVFDTKFSLMFKDRVEGFKNNSTFLTIVQKLHD